MAALPFLLAALLGCTPAPIVIDPAPKEIDTEAQEEEDFSDLVYDLEHLLAVEIELAPDDWDALRHESRGADILVGEDCQEEPYGSPYTWFEGTVTLDGEVFPGVGVRKKAFLGSQSTTKPGLKLDFEEFGGSDDFYSVDRFTLNNAVSDPAYVRQCIAYGFFADAGVPASRCSFARVSVNGEDLGLYVNVEPIKKPLLERHFGDDSGNLYEGTLSDFREGWTGTFEKKTNESEDDWSDIEALTEALTVGDDELLAALEPLVDLDAFYSFWASEVLLVHTDGYGWNTNNYYLYADPTDGRFHFLPWGTDAVLYATGMETDSVFAYSELTNRLYSHTEGRAAYLARLQQLLDEVWDEAVLAERVELMRSVLIEELDVSDALLTEAAIDDVWTILEARRADVGAELARGGMSWPYGQRDSFCIQDVGDLEASFTTTWGSLTTQDAFTYGTGSTSFTYDGQSYLVSDMGSVVGTAHGESVLYVAGWLTDTVAVLVYMTAPEESFAPGTIELDLDDAVGALFYYDAETMSEFAFLAYVVGEATLQAAGTTSGDPVIGSIEGTLMQWGA